MNKGYKHTIQTNRTIWSFLKISIVLACIFMFMSPNTLFAQVLNNTGAVISVSGGTVVQGDTIENTKGTLINEGIIYLNGNFYNKTLGTTQGNGIYNLKGNWINTGNFTADNSTVRFNGNSFQLVQTSGDTFFHFILNNTGTGVTNRLILSDNVRVSDSLELVMGNIQTNANTLYLEEKTPASLSYTSTTGSRVIGKFERGVNATDKYLFPLGSADHYNPMNLNFNNITTDGSILSEFIASYPDTLGLPLPEEGYVIPADTVEIYDTDSAGYWSVTAKNSFETDDYDVNLSGSGFSEVQNASRIIKRPKDGDWMLDGIHKDGTDSVAYRNILTAGINNTNGNEFAWGHIRPRIQTQPEDTAVCDGFSATFSIVASGRGGLTYEWQVLESSGGWQTISNNAIYANSNTDTLLIISADLSMDGYKYRAIVRDSLGNFHRSNAQATLTVNPNPVVTATPQTDTICNGSTTHIAFESDVPGTTFLIEVLNPSNSITGDIINLDGDTIKDVLTNPTNYVDSVIYRIFPIGPGTTFCDGTADTVTIFVNPTPVMSVSVSDTILCDSTTLDITVNDDLLKVKGTKVYQLTTTNAGGNVQGVQASGEYAAGLDISDNLINNTNEVQIITYTFRPRIDDDRNGGVSLCDNGKDTTLTIYVNPTPVMSVSVVDTILCDSTTLDITVNDDLLGVQGTKVYQLTTTNPGGVQGVQTSGEYAAGLDISNNLVNNTNQVQVITYTFRPRIDDPRFGGIPCCDNGKDTTLTIYVNPTPVMSVSVADTILCDSTTLDITVNDDLLGVQGTKVYQLTTTNPGGVQGVQTSGEYAAGLDISNNLVNNTNQVQVITYTFRPRIDDPRNGGIPFCDNGRDTTLTIYVNPTPVMSVSVADTILCDSTTLDITVNDDLLGVQGTKVYQLTTTNPGGVQGVQTSGEYDAGLDISNNLVNNTNQVQVITYTFRPRIDDPRFGGIPFCDNGKDTTLTIYVNPTPVMSVSVADTILCDSTTLDITVNDDLLGVQGTKVYQLTTTNPGGVQGVQTSGEYAAGLDISNNLVNNTNQVQVITYTFRPRIDDPRNGGIPFCDNGRDTTITIYVNPTPRFNVTIADTIVCDSTTITLDITDALGTVLADKVYDLSTVQSGGITGMQANGEYIIPDNVVDQLVNTTNEAQWITYYLKYRLNDTRYGGTPFCDHGIDTSITIWVNPTPQVYISVLTDTICNDTYTEITLTTPSILTSGVVTFDYVSVADVGISNNSSGLTGLNNGYVIVDSLHNISTPPFPTPLVARYIITPRALSIGCVDGPTRTDSVTVHPTAYTNMIADSVECYLASTGKLGRAIVEAENGINQFTYNWDDPYNHQTAATDSVLNIGRYTVTVTDNQSCIKVDSVLIEQPNRIIPIIDTVRNVSCSGAGDGFIILNPTGGNGGNYYTWENSSNVVNESSHTDSIGGLNGDLYHVLVEDWKGCSQDTSMFLNEPPQLTVEIYPTHISCYGAEDGIAEAVGVTSSYTYTWAPNLGSTETISNLPPGDYSVTATNAEGCQLVGETTIYEPKPLSIDSIISKRISCAGDDDGTLNLFVSEGNVVDFYSRNLDSIVNPYTFNWSTPGGTGLVPGDEDQEGLSAGTYYVTVNDWQGCYVIDTAEILGPVEYISEIVTTDVTCFDDDDGTIDLTVIGGNTESAYTFLWTTTDGNGLDTIAEDQTGLDGGNYYVTITDAIGCELLDTALIIEPDLLETFLTGTDISCFGYDDGAAFVDITGGIGNYLINWSTGETSDTITGLSANTYIVDVTDENSCFTSNFIEITEPDQILNTIASQNITCFGFNNGEIIITPEGGTIPYDYLWSHSATFTDSIANNLEPGNYTISVIDNNSCIEISTIDITQPDQLELSVDKEDITCFGLDDGYISLSMFGGTPDYTYTWSNGASSTYENLLTYGLYNINISDVNDCQVDTTIEIIEPEKMQILPFIQKPTCTDIRDGQIDLNISGGRMPYFVTWLDDGSHEEYLHDIRSGIYKVNIMDSSYCEIDTVFKVRSAFDFCINIPTVFTPNNDLINDKWVIDMSLYPNADVEVFDRFGKRVFYSEGYEESQYWDGTLNGKELPMDAYYYIIYLKNGSGRISGTVTLLR